MTEEIEPTLIEARQQEVLQYEKNIALYKSILFSLPSSWPDHLLRYRGAKNQHEVAGEITNIEDVELLAKLWYADECEKAIKSETVEMTKAKTILAILESNDGDA